MFSARYHMRWFKTGMLGIYCCGWNALGSGLGTMGVGSGRLDERLHNLGGVTLYIVFFKTENSYPGYTIERHSLSPGFI